MYQNHSESLRWDNIGSLKTPLPEGDKGFRVIPCEFLPFPVPRLKSVGFHFTLSRAEARGVPQPSSRLSFVCKTTYKEVPVPKISEGPSSSAAKGSTCHCMPQSWQCCVTTCFCLHSQLWRSSHGDRSNQQMLSFKKKNKPKNPKHQPFCLREVTSSHQGVVEQDAELQETKHVGFDL